MGLFGAAIFSKGPLCRSRERGFPLELFLGGSGRVIEETSRLAVTLNNVKYHTLSLLFFVQCSTVV